jgi:small subunit ribosomal protein S9
MNAENNQPTEMGGEMAVTTPVSQPVKGFYWGTGRRKSSIARVRIKKGSGQIMINERTLENFFKQDRDRAAIRSLLVATKADGNVDVFAEVEGGGFTGQAGAVVLGLARALKKLDSSVDVVLRDGNFLTRDPRMKERKKYGKRGARRSFQFSKR